MKFGKKWTKIEAWGLPQLVVYKNLSNLLIIFFSIIFFLFFLLLPLLPSSSLFFFHCWKKGKETLPRTVRETKRFQILIHKPKKKQTNTKSKKKKVHKT